MLKNEIFENVDSFENFPSGILYSNNDNNLLDCEEYENKEIENYNKDYNSNKDILKQGDIDCPEDMHYFYVNAIHKKKNFLAKFDK